jgi:hypothetical protein
MEPNAEINAPGFGTSTVRFDGGSGVGEGSTEGDTDEGETVTVGSDVAVVEVEVHPVSATTKHVSAARLAIGQP